MMSNITGATTVTCLTQPPTYFFMSSTVTFLDNKSTRCAFQLSITNAQDSLCLSVSDSLQILTGELVAFIGPGL